MTKTLILIAILLVIFYFYWRQNQPALKSPDNTHSNSPEPEPERKTQTIWETHLPKPSEDTPDPTSRLKIYQTAFEPATTPLSRKQKRQAKKRFKYD